MDNLHWSRVMLKRTLTLVLFLTSLSSLLADPPEKKGYAFQLPPEKAFAVLARLDKASGTPLTVSADEKALFTDAADGKLDKWSFADACLIASGVTDAAKRKEYAKKIDELEAEARKALADAKTTHEKGKKLLEFIHAGPMAKGYSSHQTCLHTILDEGKFNCVSSAVLYNVLGRRLDLDIWAVEIPGHVFSLLLYDSKRADVETTNKLGFDAKRDKETGAKLKKPDGEAYDPDKHDKLRRRVGELGLAAIIYYNRGVKCNEDKKFHEAAMVNFCALALDPTNEHAAQNALAAITNWGNKLSDAGKFEDALVVIEVGLELKPADSGLQNNYKVAWHKYAQAEMKAGKDDAALAVIRRAAKAVPGDEFVEAEGRIFMHSGEDLVKDKKWDEAIALANRGMPQVNDKAKAALKDWRNGLYLRRSQIAADKADFEQALTILKQGIDADAGDGRIQNNYKVAWHHYAESKMKDGNNDEALKIIRRAMKAVPGDEFAKAEAHLFMQSGEKLLNNKKWEDAIKFANGGLEKVGDQAKDELKRWRNGVYLRWSQELSGKSDYEKSLAILRQGMTADPKFDTFTNNSIAVYDKWAGGYMKKKDWPNAIKVYQDGLKQFPGNGHLTNNLKYCEQQAKK
jgi:tetratricopeptide (TPR) repeat protein